MIPNLGYGEMALVLVAILLLFGAKRLPELAQSIGGSVNAFKKGLRGVSDEVTVVEKEAKATLPKV